MKPEQDRVRTLLTETVTLLCKNGLQYGKELKVQGLLGITLDDADVFVVHINEKFNGICSVMESVSHEKEIAGGIPTPADADVKGPPVGSAPAGNHASHHWQQPTDGISPARHPNKRNVRDVGNLVREPTVKHPKVKVEQEEIVLLDDVSDDIIGISSQLNSAQGFKYHPSDSYPTPDTQVPNSETSLSSKTLASSFPHSLPLPASKYESREENTAKISPSDADISLVNNPVTLSQLSGVASMATEVHHLAERESLWGKLLTVPPTGSAAPEDLGSPNDHYALSEESLTSASALAMLGPGFSPFGRVRRDPKTPNKPHHCEYPGCRKSFFRRAELNRHQRWKHGGHFGFGQAPGAGGDGASDGGYEVGDGVGNHGLVSNDLDTTDEKDDGLPSDFEDTNGEAPDHLSSDDVMAYGLKDRENSSAQAKRDSGASVSDVPEYPMLVEINDGSAETVNNMLTRELGTPPALSAAGVGQPERGGLQYVLPAQENIALSLQNYKLARSDLQTCHNDATGY